MLLILCAAAPAPAQQNAPGRAAPSGVVINTEVLNDLSRASRAAPPGPAARERAAPGLLPAPDEMPRSRLLVQPLRLVEGEPPAKPRRKPLAALGPVDPAAGADPPAQASASVPALVPGLVPERVPEVTEVPPETPAPPPSAPPGGGTATAALTSPPPEMPRPEAAPPLEPPTTPPPAPPPTRTTAPPEPPEPLGPAVSPRDPGATQSAALPPSDTVARRLRLLFAADSAELSDRVKRDLETLAGQLRSDEARRVQLRAYAGGKIGSTSRARRLSLSRALAVRSFLVEKGVPARRVDVRALGTGFKGGPADRVDVVDARR
jgi:outer membrane protein OmpA-like peptidoglycan-associated protein